jgi:endonuclease/exonuclease/phosphatase family metal-dependent hydrolase
LSDDRKSLVADLVVGRKIEGSFQINPFDASAWDEFLDIDRADRLQSDLAERLKKAEVDKHVRGWEHTSDHAPVWIELSDKKIKRRNRN